MESTATFAKKKHPQGWTDQDEVSFEYDGCSTSIEWLPEAVTMRVTGGTTERRRAILLNLWEMCFLYDGYFYTPVGYVDDEGHVTLGDLHPLSFYTSSNEILNSAPPLCKSDRKINATTFAAYNKLRNRPRDTLTMWYELFSGFYYLCSDAYSGILTDHRLSLLLNVCDGVGNNAHPNAGWKVEKGVRFVIETVGDENVDLIEEGARHLGIGSSKIYKVLADVRNEIDHYIPRAKSIGKRISDGMTTNSAYPYFVYVIQIALRAAFLSQVGASINEDAIAHALRSITVWAAWRKATSE